MTSRSKQSSKKDHDHNQPACRITFVACLTQLTPFVIELTLLLGTADRFLRDCMLFHSV